jgi:hypothetical protein
MHIIHFIQQILTDSREKCLIMGKLKIDFPVPFFFVSLQLILRIEKQALRNTGIDLFRVYSSFMGNAGHCP